MVARMKCSIALLPVCASGQATRTANVRVMLYMNDQTAYAPFFYSVMMRLRHNESSCCSSDLSIHLRQLEKSCMRNYRFDISGDVPTRIDVVGVRNLQEESSMEVQSLTGTHKHN